MIKPQKQINFGALLFLNATFALGISGCNFSSLTTGTDNSSNVLPISNISPTPLPTPLPSPIPSPSPLPSPTPSPLPSPSPSPSPVPVGSGIELPIEIFGLAADSATAQSVSFAGPSVTPTSLYLQVHNLSYQNKAAIQINGGAPILLANANSRVHALAPFDAYGGIGGVPASIKLSIDLLPSDIQLKQTNTITFKLNLDDHSGVSMGYRVLAFNLKDATGNNLLPTGLFRNSDPNQWQPPLNNPSDINSGHQIWVSGNLKDSPFDLTGIQAHCMDCHTRDGRDLKYFNYSNLAIEKRAMFHGLSFLQAQQVASYIRSLNVPNPGRPWNPPFQPGPGLDSKPIIEWSAGAGLDAETDYDGQGQATLPGSGGTNLNSLKDASGLAIKNVSIRETSISMQLPDWNGWLPRKHPVDIIGRAAYESGAYAVGLQNMITQLSASSEVATRYIQSGQFATDTTLLKLSRDALDQSLYTHENGGGSCTALSSQTPPSAASLQSGWYIYQSQKLSAVHMWEIMQDFALEGVGQNVYGQSSDSRSWWNTGYTQWLFEISPHQFRGYACNKGIDRFIEFVGDASIDLNNAYISDMWYQLQVLTTTGNRHYVDGGFHTIDWGYLSGSQQIPLATQAEPLKWAGNTIKTFVEHDDGIGPASNWYGWNLRDNQPGFMILGDKRAHAWSTVPNGNQIIESLYQFGFEKNASFDYAQWQLAQGPLNNLYAGVNTPPADYILGSGSFPASDTNKQDAINRSSADAMAKQLLLLKSTFNIKSGLLSGIAAFGEMMWPKNDWSIYRNIASSSVGIPSGISVNPVAPEQALLSWNPTGGATSYNIKRAGADGNFVTVAYFVSGSNYLDRGLKPGTPYTYKISANGGSGAGPDSIEGQDSSELSVTTTAGLVVQWEPELIPPTPMNQVTDQAATNLNMTLMPAYDGQLYLNSFVNLARWVGITHTVSAYVKWDQALAATNGISSAATDGGHLPGLVGSVNLIGSVNNDAVPIFFSGLIRQANSSQWTIGARWDNCNLAGPVSTGPTVWSSNVTAFADGKSHMVTISRDSISGAVAFYIDGQPSGGGNSGTGSCFGHVHSIGKIEHTTMGHPILPGKLCDIRIYDQALSAGGVLGMYNATKSLCP